jgi:hypothetical protein
MSDSTTKVFIAEARNQHAAGTLPQWKIARLEKIPGWSWGINHGTPPSELELAERDSKILSVMPGYKSAMMTANTISERSGIPVTQVRKGLKRLLKSGVVEMSNFRTKLDIFNMWRITSA